MKGFLATVLTFLVSNSAYAVGCKNQFPKVDQDLASADLTIKKMNDDFATIPLNISDKDYVKKKIQHMFDVDQYVRNLSLIAYQKDYTPKEMSCAENEILSKMLSIDSQDTADMKDLLKVYDWIRISQFGHTADSQAWLLVQHADHDSEFQKSVLKILETLWPQKETSAKNYAYLYDRVAASWSDEAKRQLQRYGTQGMCKGPGDWRPIPIEAPEHLDERRADVGLPTFAEYKKQVDKLCH